MNKNYEKFDNSKVKSEKLQKLMAKEFVILDGAMGTMLQNSGLKLGERPEALNLSQGDLLKSIHRAYLTAGSDVIYANTFGANSHKLAGTDIDLAATIGAAVKNAQEVAAEFAEKNPLVALDVGPIGELLEPSGVLTFEEAYEIFKEVLVLGEAAGADLVIFETMTDLYEMKAAVLAAKENTALPVFATMTFEENGRTFTGCGIENMALTLTGLGVDALGINCSLGPKEILPLMEQLSKLTPLPLIAKPNAGLPDPETGKFNVLAGEFGELMASYAKLGVKCLGGCCGTTDDYIKSLCANVADLKCPEREYTPKTKVCSATEVVVVDTVRVIGERINPTGKKVFAQALRDGNISYVLNQAIEQLDAGADILDVNVGVPGLDEKAVMTWVVKAIQSVTAAPLQIDSSKVEALEAGLRACNGKPILNSVNGEDEKLAQILPLAKKYGAAVVALTMDESGLPENAQQRFEIAEKILNRALEYGIPREDVLVDCLTLTVSAQQKDCFETLAAMKRIKDELGLQLVLGVSNISFGIPNRNLINHSFLTLAMAHGLTLPIINPNNGDMMDAIAAYKVLSGQDVDSVDYIGKFGSSENKTPVTAVTSTVSNMTLEAAIMRGLDDEVVKLTAEMLATTSPLDLVNGTLIPTLDEVGKKYESGEIFLPQLIRSAGASCKAFDIIKAEIANTNGSSIMKGKIILATVKGDIHDIGKNIVKVVLENYGYEIIDLGKDVSPAKVVDTAIALDVKLIGLSALMTTTVESMAETIKAVHASGHDCKIMVGGAVLTADYAAKIGADFYAKDAKQSVDIAKIVL